MRGLRQIGGALAALTLGCAQEIIPYDDGGDVRVFSTPMLDTVTPSLVIAGTGETVELAFTLTKPPEAAMAITIEFDPPELGSAGAGVVVPVGEQSGTLSFVAGSTRQAGKLILNGGVIVEIPVVVSGLVISEIATGSAGSAEDEFIELYNPTQRAISLDGLTLNYRAATGSSFSALAGAFLSGTIASHGFFLLTRDSLNYKGETGDGTFSSGLAQGGGTLQILRGSTVEDQVAWGNANAPEAYPATAAVYADGLPRSIERKALPGSDATLMAMNGEHAAFGNALDTQDNQHDFIVRGQREPQNAASNAREPQAAGP